MKRTIISIHEDDERWLNEYSRKHHCPRTKVIRDALGEYRRKHQLQGLSYKEIIKKTCGLGKGRLGDAVKYVREIRSEWER